MVGMAVGINHRIHMVQTVGDGLQAQLRRRVNQNVLTQIRNGNAGASALVAWIFALADGAVAANHGHAS